MKGQEAIYLSGIANVNRNIDGSVVRSASMLARGDLLVKSICNSGQFAQVGGRHRLRTAPHEKEERLAAPAAGRVAHDVAGAFCGGQRGLAGAQDEAVGALAERFFADTACLAACYTDEIVKKS
jgi:hypothetical protein